MVTGRPRNSASMKDTILSDCALTFDQFVKRYGKKFPHITPGSYSVCRSILRLDGFADVISFPRGRAVVKPKPKKRTKKKTKKKSRR